MMLNTLGVVLGIFSVVSLACVTEADPTMTNTPPKNATLVYAGTFTDTPVKSQGIYSFWLRTETNGVSQNTTLVPLGVAAETPNPAFLALYPKRRLLFCANEMQSVGGKPGGTVSAFSIEPATGKL